MSNDTNNLPPLHYEAKPAREMADYIINQLRGAGALAAAKSVCYTEHLARAALSAQSVGDAEPVYQIRWPFDQNQADPWRDATEAAYAVHPAKARRILYTAPPHAAEPLLTANAKVGNGIFNAGCRERLVIDAAQRQWAHSQTDEGNAERAAELERAAPALAELQGRAAEPVVDVQAQAVEKAAAFSRGHDAGWQSAMAHVAAQAEPVSPTSAGGKYIPTSTDDLIDEVRHQVRLIRNIRSTIAYSKHIRHMDVLLDRFAALAKPAGEAQPVADKLLLDDDRRGRIYVAGPMTGIEEFNFPAFNAAAEQLRAQGHIVVNPADHGIVEGAEWGDYLRHDIAKLSTCGAIYLLPGWEKSKGARLEKHIADALGMNVVFQAQHTPEPAEATHPCVNGCKDGCLAVVHGCPSECPSPSNRPTPEPAESKLTRCAAGRDGECAHRQCPQVRDGEPRATGRHCPLDEDSTPGAPVGGDVERVKAELRDFHASTGIAGHAAALAATPPQAEPQDLDAALVWERVKDAVNDFAAARIDTLKLLEEISSYGYDRENAAVRKALAAATEKAEPDARPLIARQLGEWHEGDGPAAWWAWNGHGFADEPAWIGSPDDSDWPGYHTHWTPHPPIPAIATSAPEGGVA